MPNVMMMMVMMMMMMVIMVVMMMKRRRTDSPPGSSRSIVAQKEGEAGHGQGHPPGHQVVRSGQGTEENPYYQRGGGKVCVNVS